MGHPGGRRNACLASAANNGRRQLLLRRARMQHTPPEPGPRNQTNPRWHRLSKDHLGHGAGARFDGAPTESDWFGPQDIRWAGRPEDVNGPLGSAAKQAAAQDRSTADTEGSRLYSVQSLLSA